MQRKVPSAKCRLVHRLSKQVLSDDVDDVLAQQKRVARAWWPFGEKTSATTTVSTTETTTGASPQPAGGAVVKASVSNGGSITNGSETSFDINIRLVQNNASAGQTTTTSALDEAFLRKSKKLLRLLEARITERVTEMIASKVRHHLATLLKKANKTIAQTAQRPSEQPAVSDAGWRQHEWAAAPASMIVPDAVADLRRRRRGRQRSVRRHASPHKPAKENEDGELLKKLLQKIVRGDFAPLQSKRREVARGDKEKDRRGYKRARRDGRPAPFRWTRRREDSATGNSSKHGGAYDDTGVGTAKEDDNDRRTAHVTREGSRRHELTPGNTGRRLRRTTTRLAQPVGGSDQTSDTVEMKKVKDVEARRENSTHIATKEGEKHTSPGIHANVKPHPHTKHHSSRRILERLRNKHVKPHSHTDIMDERINVTALVNKILKSHMEINKVKEGHIRTGHFRSKTITAKHGTTGMFWFYSKLKDKDAKTVKFTEIFQATSDLKPKRKLPVATTTQRNSIPASVSVKGVTQRTDIPASVSVKEEDDISTSSIMKKRTRDKKKYSHRNSPKSQTATTKARPEPTRVASSQQATDDQGSDVVDTTVSLEGSSAVTSRHSSTKKHHVKHHRTAAAKVDPSEHLDHSKKKRQSHKTHDLSRNVFYAHWPNISESTAAEGEIMTVITESKD